ncbi:hypothetical protein C8R46DRAFT_1302736 [Mycena filopes]|nr:hypothetical protein C8R46DRAFT_1302736 [Mycena filopes]
MPRLPPFTRALIPRVHTRTGPHIRRLEAPIAPWINAPGPGEMSRAIQLLSLDIDITPWSTAWEIYEQPGFFMADPSCLDLSDFEFYTRALMLPGPVLPIAFEGDYPEPCVLLQGGQEYYQVDTLNCCLVRYGGGFSSADSFLARLSFLHGVTEDFPDALDDLYGRARQEQERLDKAAREEK